MKNHFLDVGKPIIHEPNIKDGEKVESAIIWMHGLGADAHDFESVMPYLPIKEKSIRMVFPNAPIQPVTVNNGALMRSWYDIADFNLRDDDVDGINNATNYVHDLINEQILLGIASDKIIVAGFSQGGAMSLRSGISFDKPLAGILGISCYLPNRNSFKDYENANNKNTPIFMLHGCFDPVVSYDLAVECYDFLNENGHNITSNTYQISHQLTMLEIEDIAKWIEKVL